GGIATCPISKTALNNAGYNFPGHTELLADRTGSKQVAMMMAGSQLRVTLATIHCSLAEIPSLLSKKKIVDLITLTNASLHDDFNLLNPRIAVAGLNPHGGEDCLFGSEEQKIIAPAVRIAADSGIDVNGPYSPDTVFNKAVSGSFDAVICMYHDQGLIPFKLLHFSDGVNVTLGLPIVRTSVDHGTAYDIAGKGIADCRSLSAAITMASLISSNRRNSVR
ncbi:MAG: 4-hydroxythreonine-4-phosphate dehydrogenase PdxA, partial [Desulfobacterales bacterium]|nr:4-hydroxythreonine-4-phosphate dehydrogenase PdxA [Desulfobacterales bacterium]